MSENLEAALKNAIGAAARWQAILQSPDVTASDRHEWGRWLEEDIVHRQAWNEIEKLQSSLSRIPSSVAGPALRGAEISRRDIIRRLSFIAIAVPIGLGAWRFAPWQRWRADYSTSIGQRQTHALADGSRLVLNTDSAADVLFDQQQRLVFVYSGEVLVDTAPDHQSPTRPFFVQTPHGRIEALGTRFTVRVKDDMSLVSVMEDTVRVQPADSQTSMDITQGTQTQFDKKVAQKPKPATPLNNSWLNGSLVAVDMPLKDLLEELSRYRRGILSCEDTIAGLKISGAFPLDDTERALAAITRAFPVKEIRISPLWIKLIPG